MAVFYCWKDGDQYRAVRSIGDRAASGREIPEDAIEMWGKSASVAIGKLKTLEEMSKRPIIANRETVV